MIEKVQPPLKFSANLNKNFFLKIKKACHRKIKRVSTFSRKTYYFSRPFIKPPYLFITLEISNSRAKKE
jgi:hypothetical protein